MSVMPIHRDQSRFKQIVDSAIKKNMRKYVSHGEMIGRKGGDLVSIPVPKLDIPHFRFGHNGSGGVGQGDGNIGQPIGKGPDKGDGQGEAGSDPGEHILEVERTLDELAKLLQEALELPDLEPKGKAEIESEHTRKVVPYHQQGNPKDTSRTLRQWTKRRARMATTPGVLPHVPLEPPRDVWRRGQIVEPEPEAQAVLILMMDVSGSMTQEVKQIARIKAFWEKAYLTRAYKGLQVRFVIHDAQGREVDEETFYNTRESGGTKISSGYKVVLKLINKDFPPELWNIYFSQFSDGDNYDEDNDQAKEYLKEIAALANLVGYNQVDTPNGKGSFIKIVKSLQDEFPNIRIAKLFQREDIPDGITAIWGKDQKASVALGQQKVLF